MKKFSVGHKATRPASSDVSYDLGSAAAWFLAGVVSQSSCSWDPGQRGHACAVLEGVCTLG